MRVALDAGPLGNRPTGVGRYTEELVAALERRGIEPSLFAVALRGPSRPGVARWRVPARLAQASWRAFGGPSIERLVGLVDVVHATNFVLPALRRAAGIVTVHDLSFLRDDVFPGGERLRELVPWSVKRAARVIAPTGAIAAEIAADLSVPKDRISVTPEGVAPAFFGATPLSDGALRRMGISSPFALCAATIEPRKNLPRLLEAWAVARADLPGWSLVVAGARGWGKELSPPEDVVLAGWVDHETLPGLLAAAAVFCYPSLYEGFGLPPLEAMAAGTPAIVGDYTAAREVVADAALIVDARDVDDIARALVTLGGDGGARRRLAIAGRARAASFTWDRCAAATLDAYKDALRE